MSDRLLQKLHLSLIAAAVVLVYGASLQFDFLNYDDVELILSNESLRFLDFGKIFTDSTTGLYHPITSLSYALDFKTGAGQVISFRITQLLLHLINGSFVYFICLQFWKSRLWLAFAIAMLFVLHPLKVESVAWLTERKDLLAAFGVLGSLYFYLRAKQDDWKNLAVSGLFFLLALLSKISILLFPLCLVIYSLGQRRNWKILLLYFLLVPPLFWLNYQYQNQYGVEIGNLFARLLLLPEQLGFYVLKWLAPLDLLPIYRDYQLPEPMYLWLTCLVFFAFSFLTWRRFPEERKNFYFSLSFFALILLPNLKLIRYGDQGIVNDRYMYLASLGLCWMILPGWLGTLWPWEKNKRYSRQVAIALLLLALLGLGKMSYQQVQLWSESEYFWSQLKKYYPKDAEVLHNLAHSKILKRDLQEVPELLESAEKNWVPKHGQVLLTRIWMHRGLILLNEQKHEEAAKYFVRGLEVNPGDEKLHYNLGLSYLKQKRFAQAEASFQKSLQLNPSRAESLLNLGVIEFERKDLKLALQYFTQALQVRPDLYEAAQNKAVVEKLLQINK